MALLAWPLRPNPSPPSSLMAFGMLERWKKRFQKKFLMGRPYTPPPPLMARPLRGELFFGFPYNLVLAKKHFS